MNTRIVTCSIWLLHRSQTAALVAGTVVTNLADMKMTVGFRVVFFGAKNVRRKI
jgi:hypothetical protein